MKGVGVIYTIKTLLGRGWTISRIAREIGADRKTVRKIKRRIKAGDLSEPVIARKSKLDRYTDIIEKYTEKDWNSLEIYNKLKFEIGVGISYSSVKRYIAKHFKIQEAYMPLICAPGEEAQVDFGYAGMFKDNDGKKKKIWVFLMRLSHSRFDYYELVTNQRVSTFIKCHENAFGYFGGVPKSIKLDNLKAGVLKYDPYEPIFQREYKMFLEHYESEPIACRSRGSDKGKVEAGIKYVKNSFFKHLETKDLNTIEMKLKNWQENICNKRIHGTTRKIPKEVYEKIEKDKLLKLPDTKYDCADLSIRKVNNYAHIFYDYSFYSVPAKYVGKEVLIKDTGKIIKIYDGALEIALHTKAEQKGEFKTIQLHNPHKGENRNLREEAMEYGGNIYIIYQSMKKQDNKSYNKQFKGILSLIKKYDKLTVDTACKKAMEFGILSYRAVKNLCGTRMEIESIETENGFYHNLSKYDELTEGASYAAN